MYIYVCVRVCSVCMCLYTLAPLLGPIGGGLGLGVSALAGSAVAAGGSVSSAALTTSLETLLFWKGKETIWHLTVVVLEVTFGVTKNLEAADAILQLAIINGFEGVDCLR